jgi:hypothetical protein
MTAPSPGWGQPDCKRGLSDRSTVTRLPMQCGLRSGYLTARLQTGWPHPGLWRLRRPAAERAAAVLPGPETAEKGG